MNISFVDSQILFFGIPFVASAGLLLNLTVLLLIMKCHILDKLSTPLVTLLCVSDGGFLLVLLFNWVDRNYVNIYHVSGMCQIAVFTSHMFGFMSSWMVVSLCAMTLFSLASPEKFLQLCTPTASRLLVSVFGVFIFSAYLYKTWTHGTTDTIKGPLCTVIPENKLAMRVLTTIDVLLFGIVPCLVIFIVQLILMMFVLFSSCRKEEGSVTLDVVRTSSNTSLRNKNVETSYTSSSERDVLESDCEDSDTRNLELLNVTHIFMEPLRTIGENRDRELSVTWDNWIEAKDTRVSHVPRLSFNYSDTTIRNWKNTMIFSLFFMCLVLPGAVENIAFMVQANSALSNFEIYKSSSRQVFQLMFYCHFALDGFVYASLTRTFWKSLLSKSV